MKKHKIGAILLTTILIGAMVLTGCGKKEQPAESNAAQANSDEPVTIVWKRGKDTTPATAKLIEAFQNKYKNITVKQEDLPATSTEQHNTYTTALAAGDDSIDIVTMDIVWANEFASSGWLLDIGKYFPESKQNEFFKGPISAMKYNGKIYAVPAWTDAGVLYYRKDLVPNPPKTWDELIKLSNDNVGKNGIEQGFLFQAFQNEALVCNALEFITSNGGNILDDNGKSIIDSSKAIEGINIMKSLIDKGVAPKGVVAYKPQDCIDQFVKGNTLFMRNWSFAYAATEADSSAVKGKVAIAPLPVGPSGTEGGSTLGGWNFAINKNSKHIDASWKFIEFATSEEGQKIGAIEGAAMPTRESVYTNAEVVAKFPAFKQFLPAFKVAKPRPLSPYYSKLSDTLQINLHKAITGETPVETALKESGKQINEINKK